MMKTTCVVSSMVVILAASLVVAQAQEQKAGPLELGKSLLAEARELEKEGKHAEAVARAEAAVAAFEKAEAAGKGLEWHTNNTILWAADVARRDLLAYGRAIELAEKVIALNEGHYWAVNARMNMAETYRAWGKFDEAHQQYAAVLKMSERDSPRVLLARGHMLYFELGERDEGQKQILQAVQEEGLHHVQRFRAVRDLVQSKLKRRDHEAALQLLALLIELPHLDQKHRDAITAEAYYRMGEIHRTTGNTAEAKGYYRKAMDHEGGDMRYRVMARNALEDILYFE